MADKHGRKMSAEILKATNDDIKDIAKLLEAENLPPDDMERWIENFFVLKIDGITAGAAGIEVWGNTGLFRSFVVAPEQRSKGFGQQLYDSVISLFGEIGLTAIVLLSKGGSGFFEKEGFRFIPRSDVPSEAKNSVQFNLDGCKIYDVMIIELN